MSMDPTDSPILTLDDDHDFNTLVKHIFKRHGIKVTTTETVEEFIAQLKETKPKLCLIDINLDRGFGAGFSLLQALRNKYGLSIPIIMLSRRKEDKDIIKALELGANDYIYKPIDDAFLLSKINHFLRHDQIQPLPYYKVSEKDSPCKLTWDSEIIGINEFGLTLRGSHFAAKGTRLYLDTRAHAEIFGDYEKIKLFVSKSWIDSQTHLYHSYCEYDYENEDLLAHIRSYLLTHT